MKKTRCEMMPIEMAMRSLRLVESLCRYQTPSMTTIARNIADAYGCSIATGYRMARLALDVLGIHYDYSHVRGCYRPKEHQVAA